MTEPERTSADDDTSADDSDTNAEPRGPTGRDVRWPALVAGIVMIVVVGWVGLTAWSGFAGSHPIGWITLLVGIVFGLALIAWALLAGPPTEGSVALRWIGRIAVGLVAVVLLVVVVYTRPFPAESVAIEALDGGPGVTIDDGWTRITMVPDEPRATGLAYYPGARVDPRAYARVLLPVAEAGFTVVVYKQPYNLAILASSAADGVVGDPDDAVEHWVVGGHSLGGAMASRYAETDRDELAGLLLHASFPVNDMSDRSLPVASISGTNDGLADTGDIADSVPKLPADTEFVSIDGAIHSYFGDYGSQRGDGEPEISRQAAQEQITSATIEFLELVDATASG